jgi:hypothetical protein
MLVRIFANSAYYFGYDDLSAGIGSAATGLIFIKFVAGDLYGNLYRVSKFD